MKDKLEQMLGDLRALQSYCMNVRNLANEIRLYYKYQNEETDSLSESFILSFNDIENTINTSMDEIKSLIEYEEERECDCEEE